MSKSPPSPGADADLATVVAFLGANLRPDSVRVYRSQFEHWWEWCEARGLRPWPAQPVDLAAYTAALAAAGRREVTLRSRTVSIIGRTHRRAGFADPSDTPEVRGALADAIAMTRKALTNGHPLRSPARAIEHGRQAPTPADSPAGRRDAALIAVLREGRLTLDELRDLRWNAVTQPAGGTATVRLPSGEVRPLSRETMLLLEATRRDRPSRSMVFQVRSDAARPLSAITISALVRNATHATGRLRRGATHVPRGQRRRGGTSPERRHTRPHVLDRWCAAHGWSADDLARALGVGPSELERWRQPGRPLKVHLQLALDALALQPRGEAPPPPATAAVRAWMKDGHWSSASLARALDVSTSTIGNWRIGRCPAPRYLLLSITGAELTVPETQRGGLAS